MKQHFPTSAISFQKKKNQGKNPKYAPTFPPACIEAFNTGLFFKKRLKWEKCDLLFSFPAHKKIVQYLCFNKIFKKI